MSQCPINGTNKSAVTETKYQETGREGEREQLSNHFQDVFWQNETAQP